MDVSVDVLVFMGLYIKKWVSFPVLGFYFSFHFLLFIRFIFSSPKTNLNEGGDDVVTEIATT